MAEIVEVVTRINYEVEDAALKSSTGELLKQLNTAQDLQGEINRLEKEQAILGKNEVKRQQEITEEIEAHKLAIDSVTQSILKQIQADEKLASSINRGTQEIKRQKQATDDASRSITQFANTATTGMATFTRNSGVANNAAFALSQTLREAPAFAYSFQTGLLGISNNIPILADRFNELKASTGSTGASLAILGRSIFGMTNLLTIGIGVLTIFGGKLFDSGEEAKDTSKEVDQLADSISNLISKQRQLRSARGTFTEDGTKAAEKQLELLKARGASETQIDAQERRLAALRKRDLQNEIDAYDVLKQTIFDAFEFYRGKGYREEVVRESIEGDKEIIKSLREVTGVTQEEAEKIAKSLSTAYGTDKSPVVGFNARQQELRNQQSEIDADVKINDARREKAATEKAKRDAERQRKEAERLRGERKKDADESLKIQFEAQKTEVEESNDYNKKISENEKYSFSERFDALEEYYNGRIRLIIEKAELEKLLGKKTSVEMLAIDRNAAAEIQKIADEAAQSGNKLRNDQTKAERDAVQQRRIAVNEASAERANKEKAEQAKKIQNLRDYERAFVTMSNTVIGALSAMNERERILIDERYAAQERRVQDAVVLAERGNVDVYNAEKQRLDAIAKEREINTQKQIQLNGLLQASNAAVAVTEALLVVTNAGKTGDPYTTAARIAAAVAAVASGFALVSGLVTSFRGFKDGVIDFDGKGTGTSDSNLVRISKGESVITADNTNKFRPLLQDIHTGRIKDMSQIGNYYTMDTKGIEYGLSDVVDAVEGSAPKVNVKMDEHGIAVFTQRAIHKQRRRRL